MGDATDTDFWVRPFQAMEWSNEAALALIEEYRRQPSLWDPRHHSYTSKSQKHEAWDAIAAAMQLDALEVRQKMNSLLGSFRRERSRMRKGKANGQGGYCPKWFAFEKMNFLIREDEIDTSGSKMEEEEETLLEELCFPVQDALEQTQNDKKTASVSQKRQRKASKPPPDPLLDDLSIFSTQDETASASSKRQRKVSKAPPDPLLDDLSIFPSQDECSAFGQYLACKLRRFDARTRAFVEHAINNVLFEADMGRYDDAPSPTISQ